MEKDQRTDNQCNCRHKQSNYKRELGRTRSTNWMNRGRLLPSFPSPEFLRNLWIAEIIFVEVKEVQAQAVLHFALAQIVQVRLPVPVLGQILCHMLGQKNMPGITTIHDALCDVESRPCHVRFVVNIPDRSDGAAVNSHTQLDAGMILQRSANLDRASRRFFRTMEKQERHPVSG